jgi:hypothetical protein
VRLTVSPIILGYERRRMSIERIRREIQVILRGDLSNQFLAPFGLVILDDDIEGSNPRLVSRVPGIEGEDPEYLAWTPSIGVQGESTALRNS